MSTDLPTILTAARRRNSVTFKLLFIGVLIVVLQIPLILINELREERSKNREAGTALIVAPAAATNTSNSRETADAGVPLSAAAEGYRMAERALKHGMLVITLVFAAFFLFETLADLRLHAVHYGLVGAALCLFYLAFLALGEVLSPGWAFVGAALASSLLITLYCVSILRSASRATMIASLLTAEYSVLYVVLRMEDYALLAGTASLFVALAAVMFFTRRVDWFAQEQGNDAKV
ncbi:MAG: inner membrane CreD family protein [Candidatus Didemnitutus sp.]|nr:inner membrane CreD family protein [Candidatus Didemnitutus sp.]